MAIFRSYSHDGYLYELSTSDVEWGCIIAGATATQSTSGGTDVVDVNPLRLSTRQLTKGDEVRVSALIRGKQMSLIYFDVYLADPELGLAYGPVYRELARSAKYRVTGNGDRPILGEEMLIQTTWTPVMRVLTDGTDRAFGFITPEGYTQDKTKTRYMLRGFFTPAETRQPTKAKLSFDYDGRLTNVFTYRCLESKEIPQTLTPKPGDQFTPLVNGLSTASEQSDIRQENTYISNILTLQDERLWWLEVDLFRGNYLVGFTVVNNDGKYYRHYTELTIK